MAQKRASRGVGQIPSRQLRFRRIGALLKSVLRKLYVLLTDYLEFVSFT